MLALAWPWERESDGRTASLAARLASSLCAGIGGFAHPVEIDGLHFAYRPLTPNPARRTRWAPTALPSGRLVVFHGYFDNAERISAELGADRLDPALLYGLAVERWQDEAERRIIGEYCAAIADVQSGRLRLSRSPLRAPPLYYHHGETIAVAASVPRAIFAAGVDMRLDEDQLADNALGNFTDTEASCFREVARVPLGAVVELERFRPRILRKTYDLLAVPAQRVTSDAAVIRRAGELLEEGVRACMSGFSTPGTTLSAGLDSTQVAIRALAALPLGKMLPTFTFHPEPTFDGRVPKGRIGDERPWVEAFVRLHPGLEAHFTDNAGYGHDHRWKELFHLIGSPAALNTMYVFHGLMSAAAKRGCDVLLLAEWGNLTFSDKGEAGYVEYLLTGRWRELWLALTRLAKDEGSIARCFASRSLSALLPELIWRPLRRLFRGGKPDLYELVQPLSAGFRHASGVDNRLRDSGIALDRYQPRSRRHSRRLLFANGDLADVYQGLEQMYGVALRDPAAYRPFAEFCLGLPTWMFMRGGELRWLARQMATGIMPEEQRTTSLTGWWDADWHVRIGRRRKDYLIELDRLGRDERIARMLDLPRLRAALESWPEKTETDPQKCFVAQLALPRALLTARFIHYVEGRNL